MELSQEQLQQMLPNNHHTNEWYEALLKVLPDYEITTPLRIAAFIAQCSHESGQFTILKENLNYRAETLTRIWPSRFPADVAATYAALPNKQEAIANRAYADRMGNGPESSGDGFRYCGRGLIQLTGKNNYKSFADSLGMNLEDVPEFLGTFEGATQSACWFWKSNNLNRFSDVGDMDGLTKAINGGYNGLEERKRNYENALQILGV
jgi:putative chitinase